MKKNLIKKLKKFLKRVIIIAFFIITAAYAYSLNFSEIMYNPQGSDTGREWIELTNPECENLEEFVLFENNINHRINMFSDGTCDYPLICDDCTLILNEYNVTTRLYESSFTLSNTGEYLELRLNNTIIDSINYTGIESSEGESLTKYDEWLRAFPTPGYFVLQEINQTINNTNQTINETTNITLNETINTTLNITLNETINNTINNTINKTVENNSTENNTIEKNTSIENNEINKSECNITIGIKIKDDKLIYYNKETIKFQNTLNISNNYKAEYYIEYWIEDIYGNILKNSIQTNNLNEKSYTPTITEKTVAIIIKNKIVNVTCNNFTLANIINDSSEKILVLKNPDYKEKECNKCEKCTSTTNNNYEELKDEESNINVMLTDNNLELSMYRGNDRKYVINTEMKNEKNRKVTDLVKISLEKYSGATIELPLITKECGEFSIVTEGLGFIDTQKYLVECEQNITHDDKKDNNVSSQTMTKQQTSQQTTNAINDILKEENATKNVSQFFYTPLITGEVAYESKNEKTKEYSLIGIIILLAGTAIYAIYKITLSKRQAR